MAAKLDKVKGIALGISDSLLDLRLLIALLPVMPEGIGGLRKSKLLNEDELEFLGDFATRFYLEKLEQIALDLDSLLRDLKNELGLE